MAKYALTTTQRWVIETDDIRVYLDNLEFVDTPEGLTGDAEFLDGSNTYEVIE